MGTHPPVFFVRVARKGLMLDAASTNGGRFKGEWSKLKMERARNDSRGLSVDPSLMRWKAQKWRRDDRIVGRGQRLRFTINHSIIVTNCQYTFCMY
jgi:hypothetical protein